MQRWSAFILAGMLGLAVFVGLFIEPSDSQANLNTATWYGEYFSNPGLSGDPLVTRSERNLNFNWAENAPARLLPADQFSARWTGNFPFEAGTWLFSVGADDGVRVWLNDELLIDQWQSNPVFTIYSVEKTLRQGNYTLHVEYYDNGGPSGLKVEWTPVASTIAVASIVQEAPAPQTNPQSSPLQGNPIANIAADTLNIRSGPGISYPRVAQVYLYQRFPIVGVNKDASWYLLQLKDGSQGWAAAVYLYITGSTVNVPIIDLPTVSPSFSGASGVALDNLIVRSQATSNSTRLGTIPDGETMTIVGRNKSSAWYEIRYNDLSGWVFAPFVSINVRVYDIPFSDTVFAEEAAVGEVFSEFDGATGLTTDYVRLRTLPSTLNSEVIGNIPVNAEVDVLGRSNNSAWYLVEYEGDQGWISALFVELQDGVRPFNVPFVE